MTLLSPLLKCARGLFGNVDGQDLAEYGMALAIISLGAALAAVGLATNLSTLYSQIEQVMTQVI